MSIEPISADHAERCRARLRETLACDGPVDVARAALWIAAEVFPGLNVDLERDRLRRIARKASRDAAELDNPFARFDAVRTCLFETLGFTGNADEYDHPDNSYLNRVLDSRRGIPITLSLITIEALRAAGFVACGVGLPGHYVVRFEWDGRVMLCDPFHGGSIITEEDCRRLVGRSTGRAALFRRGQLQGCSAEATVRRLLRNLKRIHLAREDYTQALAIVEMLLAVDPEDVREVRDRGILRAHQGRPDDAMADLERYLECIPDAEDAASVRGRIAWLRRRTAGSNEAPG